MKVLKTEGLPQRVRSKIEITIKPFFHGCCTGEVADNDCWTLKDKLDYHGFTHHN